MSGIITGIVRKLTEVKTGTSAAGRTWAQQQVVVEYGEQIQVEVAFDFDPDKKPEFASLQVGDEVRINYWPRSTESKTGGYFSSNIPTRLEIIRQATGVRVVNAPVAQPAASTPAPAPTPIPAAPSGADLTEKEDDLPF